MIGAGARLIYKFEDFVLDIERRELRRGDALVDIEPQVFDLLHYLIDNCDRLVSKDDLVAKVWHGRAVSDSTVSSRITAVRHAIGDDGARQHFIRTIPRKGFRFVGMVDEGSHVARAPGVRDARDKHGADTPLDLPNRPSIAVLPFTNMSGDLEQDYFSDGISEDIITALSQFQWLFVIARNSSFVFKGRVADVKQIAYELGVRYLLEGSVRKATNRVRITAQLIDAASGTHLWAERFDGAIEDIFELQDQVTASVVGAIAPKLEQAEIERARRKPTDSLDAYDYYLRGVANVHQDSKSANDAALRLFGEAIKLDPDFASAYGMSALCYVARKWKHWTVDTEQEVSETARLVERAAQLGRSDAVALSASGMALGLVVQDLDAAAALLDRALLLNPNLAASWVRSAWVRLCLGEPDLAIEHAARAMRLSPLDPLLVGMQSATAFAHFFAGRYDESCSWAARALKEQPNFGPALRILAASSSMAERPGDAAKAVARAKQINPGLRIHSLQHHLPFRPPEYFANYALALRKAGLPD